MARSACWWKVSCKDRMPVKSSPAHGGRAHLRVLLVEDEALLRWALAETLARAGHEIIEASDASRAMEVVRTAVPIDVVLLDLRLPDSSDLSLLKTIRHQSPSSAVVMMSAHGTAETAAEAKALGAYDMLTKPFDLSGIEEHLLNAYWSRHH